MVPSSSSRNSGSTNAEAGKDSARLISESTRNSLDGRSFFMKKKSTHTVLARMSTLRICVGASMEKELKGGSRTNLLAMSPANFNVEVVVENKPLARDPEGEA